MSPVEITVALTTHAMLRVWPASFITDFVRISSR